jgi:hypothetical protein
VEKPQIFRSPTAVVVWVVWLLFAVGNWIDLAVQGRDHLSVVAAAVLLLATGIAYVTAQRPRIISDDAGVTVRNPLRDHRIGWAGVAEIDLVDLLRVHCAWGGPPGAAPADRERIVKLLQTRATAARAEAVWAPGTTAAPTAQATPGTTTVATTGWAEPLTSTWSRRALAALLIPALILLIVVLI